ncbi:MAG: hypothetical protein RIR31_687 [Bacteroidota bacterium]|jgi:hypothetical protein
MSGIYLTTHLLFRMTNPFNVKFFLDNLNPGDKENKKSMPGHGFFIRNKINSQKEISSKDSNEIVRLWFQG